MEALDVYARRIYFLPMEQDRLANMLGALALMLTDELRATVEAEAPEPGGAAAALVLCGKEEEVTIERLRRVLGLSHPGAVRLVDRLVAAGVLERRPSVQDRRAVTIHPTRTGRRIEQDILSVRRATLKRALNTLDPTECRQFEAIVAKLLVSLTRDHDHADAICRLCEQTACTECPVDGALRFAENSQTQ